MKKLIVILLAIVVIAGCGAGYFMLDMNSDIKGGKGSGETIVVEIPKGSGANAVGEILKDAGVIKSDFYFKLYTKKYPPQGLQYGSFNLSKDMSYDEILQNLTKIQDKLLTVSVTIPEGSTLIKFSKIVEEAGFCTAQEFIDTVENTDWSEFKFYQYVKEDPNKPFKMEGFLFPDTYEFFPEATPEDIARKMLGHFDSMITDDMYTRIENMGMDLQDVIILASYVQEEAGDPINQPDVAAVFLNRLKPESPYPKLQSDVSYYYIREFIEPYLGVGRDQSPQELQNAVNTYLCDGIPVTPVSSPGIDAIKAVLDPTKDSPYYFFLTDLTGKYYYAVTSSEHERNIGTMKQVNAGVGK